MSDIVDFGVLLLYCTAWTYALLGGIYFGSGHNEKVVDLMRTMNKVIAGAFKYATYIIVACLMAIGDLIESIAGWLF